MKFLVILLVCGMGAGLYLQHQKVQTLQTELEQQSTRAKAAETALAQVKPAVPAGASPPASGAVAPAKSQPDWMWERNERDVPKKQR